MLVLSNSFVACFSLGWGLEGVGPIRQIAAILVVQSLDLLSKIGRDGWTQLPHKDNREDRGRDLTCLSVLTDHNITLTVRHDIPIIMIAWYRVEKSN